MNFNLSGLKGLVQGFLHFVHRGVEEVDGYHNIAYLA
jgi:hypothetical protein